MNAIDRPIARPPCRGCWRSPAAFPGVGFCFGCWPGGPVTPPPCLSCGRRVLYFIDGLCRRCHPLGDLDVGSCPQCLAWGTSAKRRGLCSGCVSWQDRYHRTAPCESCSRIITLDKQGYCRLCRKQAALVHTYPVDVPKANRHGQQLFIADLFWRQRPQRPAPTPQPETGTGTGRASDEPGHEQLLLFTVAIDLRCGTSGLAPPPDLELAAAVEQQAREHGARYGWSHHTTSKVRYGIRAVLALQAHPGEPVTWTETQVLKGAGLPIRHVLEVLEHAGMLRDDRPRRTIENWFEAKVADLPAQMIDELRIWFTVMLHGSATPPRRRPRTQTTIQVQLNWALRALRPWAEDGHESLREISCADIEAILPASGNPRAELGQGLKSIFRVLKARKVVFTDPAARVDTGYAAPRQPLPIDLHALRQALDSPDPARAALTALVAFHGLRSGQVRHLQLTDIRNGRLYLDGRVILLAAPVRRRLTRYLNYRNKRWPNTANPHLFITAHTALRTTPAAPRWVILTAGIRGAIQAIREDRILHEAHATAGDVRRLADLFGLSITAAERYAATVDHPDLVRTPDPQNTQVDRTATKTGHSHPPWRST